MSWDDLVTTALLGTQRREPDLATWPGPLGEAARALPGEPAAVLLAAAALATTYRRAGAPTTSPSSPPPPSPAALPETRRSLPSLAEHRLEDFLAHPRHPLFPQWLQAAAAGGFVVPPRFLPALLEVATRTAALREAVVALGGERGAWLAPQRPSWAAWYSPPVARDEGDWQLGDPDQRAAWLLATRATDPAAAVAALGATWAQEPGPLRAEFLPVLRTGLGPDDEPLLERALDDRRGDVRGAARALLVHLPSSAFVARTTARARLAVVGQGRGLGVVFPGTPDPDAARDGVEDDPSVAGRRASWLRQVVASAPLAAWVPLGTPEEILARPVRDDWGQVLRSGWFAAVEREGDPDWALAMLRTGYGAESPDRSAALIRLLPPETRATVLTQLMRQLMDQPSEARVELGRVRDVGGLLATLPAPWPPELAHLVLRWVHGASLRSHPQAFVRVFAALADGLPSEAVPALAALAEQLPTAPPWRRELHQVAAVLTARAEMLQELQ